MSRCYLMFVFGLIAIAECYGQDIKATTTEGKSVTLHSDGTWEYEQTEKGSGAAVNKGTPDGAGGGAFGLQMIGWRWGTHPRAPKLQESNMRGKVVFDIEVNENGEITSIKTVANELGPTAERLCREELEKHTLEKTTKGKAVNTKGRVTFNLDLQ